MTQSRRMTGANLGIWAAPINNGVVGNAVWLNNAYNVTANVDIEEIDTTAFGDFPWSSTEPGLMSLSIDLSMRNRPGSPDVQLVEMAAYNRLPLRVGVVQNRTGATAGNSGRQFSVIATKASFGGEVRGAQDLTYTLRRTEYGPAPNPVDTTGASGASNDWDPSWLASWNTDTGGGGG